MLELYKLAVEMADRISARRGSTNAFFLTVQTALLAAVGLSDGRLDDASPWASVVISAAGVALSATWWLQLRSYRDLNAAKFKVINQMEETMGIDLFRAEWQHLKTDPIPNWRQRYAELGMAERFVPVVFAGLYLVVLIARLAE